MIRFIDKFLNNIAMYRLALYYLIALAAIAIALSFFGFLPFSPAAFLFSLVLITAVCWVTNKIFARVFKAPANVESVYISALILALIITPPGSFYDFSFLFWAAALAMASKFIFAIGKKHIFNPAAFAVALTSLTINQSASWWVGTSSMLIFVLAGGLLIARKIRRFDLVISFFAAALVSIFSLTLVNGGNSATVLSRALLDSPIIFFVFIMLTEPQTTPPTKKLRVFYGALTGFLFAPQIHLGGVYSTPELALLAGNIFSYLASPKEKLILKLKEKIRLAPDVYEFLFKPDSALSFKPGQYLEWTLGHKRPDSRGIRRYFTVASSPTEEEIKIGVKFYPEPSSFKKSLAALDIGGEIVAAQRAGDFTLPKNPNKKLVFIAGGIGITPFRSMIKYLLDTREKRPIILFYSTNTEQDIVYRDLFYQAWRELGIKTVYKAGVFITEETIKTEAPDYQDRLFYLSGPHAMVTAFEKTLAKMGVPRSRIKTDYFPGYA